MKPQRAVFGALVLVLGGALAAAQTAGSLDVLKRGIQLFAEGRYAEAQPLFDTLSRDTAAGTYRSEGAYWSAQCLVAEGRLDDAATAIDAFLKAYPGHGRLEELVYQRGRVHHLKGQYEEAVQVFASYIATYPDGGNVPAAVFWSAEGLYALGKLDEAERLYTLVTDGYAASVKAEAARYRLSLVQFKRREDELLTLLKWSHEESLRIIEEFQRREKAYEQALAVYQKRYGEIKTGTLETQSGLEEEIAALKSSMDDLAKRLQEKDDMVAQLESSLAAARQSADSAEQLSGSVAAAGAEAELLAMKERTLALIELYLQILLGEASEASE